MYPSRTKTITTFSGLLCTLLVLSSCSFSARQCRHMLEKAERKGYDMVIVPGVPFENGRWSDVMKIRVCWSKYLYDRGIAKNVMYSGSAVYSPYCEAVIMALYAEALGIPKEHIFIETKAEHSTENAYYSYKKAKKLGFQHIAIASDPFQTKLLRRFTRKVVSSEVDLIPIVYDSLRPCIPIQDPTIRHDTALVKDFVSIVTRQPFLKRLKGTRGKLIDTSAY